MQSVSLVVSISYVVVAVSERRGTKVKVLRTLAWKPRLDSGFDRLKCAILARQRPAGVQRGRLSSWVAHFWRSVRLALFAQNVDGFVP